MYPVKSYGRPPDKQTQDLHDAYLRCLVYSSNEKQIICLHSVWYERNNTYLQALLPPLLPWQLSIKVQVKYLSGRANAYQSLPDSNNTLQTFPFCLHFIQASSPLRQCPRTSLRALPRQLEKCKQLWQLQELHLNRMQREYENLDFRDGHFEVSYTSVLSPSDSCPPMLAETNRVVFFPTNLGRDCFSGGVYYNRPRPYRSSCFRYGNCRSRP